MRHSLLRSAALLAALALAVPAVAAPALHLSWDHCAAGGRVANKAFACDTNAGSDVLVLSFDPPEAKSDVSLLEVRVHIQSSNGSLPEWWRFATGTCRATGMSSNISPTAAGSCEYPLGQNSGAGIAAFQVDWFGPGSLRILAAVGVPQLDQFAVAPGHEYFALALVLRHIRTVGTGSCGGCATPVCIGFGALRLMDQWGGTSSLDIYAGGAGLGGSDATVTWQNAFVRDYLSAYQGNSEYVSMTCDPDNTVPNRYSTWGAVKSLYR